jgi:hypothetical protein
MLANCTAFLKPFLRSRNLSPTFRLLGKTRFDFFFCARSFNNWLWKHDSRNRLLSGINCNSASCSQFREGPERGCFNSKNWSNGKTATGLIVSVVWRGDPANIERSATEIADIVLQADSNASDQDFVTVKFLGDYSIGFATLYKNRQVSHIPAAWIKQIRDRM